ENGLRWCEGRRDATRCRRTAQPIETVHNCRQIAREEVLEVGNWSHCRIVSVVRWRQRLSELLQGSRGRVPTRLRLWINQIVHLHHVALQEQMLPHATHVRGLQYHARRYLALVRGIPRVLHRRSQM